MRRKTWTHIYFHQPSSWGSGPITFLKTTFQTMNAEEQSFVQGLIVLYMGKVAQLSANVRSCRNDRVNQSHFADLHHFIKREKAQDVKFTQAILGALPRENMQDYFAERNADTGYQPTPF